MTALSAGFAQPADATLDSFCHTMIIVLVDSQLLKSEEALWNWLVACSMRVKASDGRHGMLAVALDERTGHAFLNKRREFATLQLLDVYELGERAIRAATLALRLFHQCRLLLASALPTIAITGLVICNCSSAMRRWTVCPWRTLLRARLRLCVG